MKKLFFMVSFLISSMFCLAQGGNKPVLKDIPVKYDENSAEAQKMLQQITIPSPEKDCGEFHLGKVMFVNTTSKAVAFELVDVKGNKMCTLDIKNGSSAYINEIEVGEYYIKKIGSKKGNKKNVINVVECMMKAIAVDEKMLK